MPVLPETVPLIEQVGALYPAGMPVSPISTTPSCGLQYEGNEEYQRHHCPYHPLRAVALDRGANKHYSADKLPQPREAREKDCERRPSRHSPAIDDKLPAGRGRENNHEGKKDIATECLLPTDDPGKHANDAEYCKDLAGRRREPLNHCACHPGRRLPSRSPPGRRTVFHPASL